MKLIFIALFFSIASAGRLENTYLPPISPKFAGGNGRFLATPSFSLRNPSSNFNHRTHQITPYLDGISISNAYLPPSPAIRSSSVHSATLVPIIRLKNENIGDGSYRYGYQIANHISGQGSGPLKNGDSSEVQGSFSYQAPNGQAISLSYIADENGYRAVGDHLPTEPPVPASILKSLEFNGVTNNGVSVVAPSTQFSTAVSNQYLPPFGRQGGY